ncbi:MAG: PadR family transcriptional regulator [Dethiobacteria bacterium]|nr:PadR family transcriptional regulator [Dethiobacteria bacterium]
MSIKYAILGLLHYSDMHGYKIKEHIENNFGYMWTINFGQIYPNLKELENSGLIRMKDISPSDGGGPQKKLYTLEDPGREEFSRWLASEPERPMILRDPFLLKFAFFGFGDHKRALEIIDDQIVVYENNLNRRTRNSEKWKKQGAYVNLLAKLGVTQNEMYLNWLLEARKEIENAGKEAVVGSLF